MRAFAVLALAACGTPTVPAPKLAIVATVDAAPVAGAIGAPIVPAPVAPVPKVRFAVWHDTKVEFGETAGATIAMSRTVEMPADVADLQWVLEDPIVMIGATTPESPAIGPHDGEVGRISATGYEPFARLPAKTFAIKQPKNTEKFDPPWWSLVVSDAHEIWQARCDWGVPYDGIGCTDFVYARLSPTPLVVKSGKGAPVRAAGHELVEAPASTTTKVVEVKLPPSGGNPATKILHCTEGTSATVEVPAKDDRAAYGGLERVRWLRTDPPVYEVTHTQLGFVAFEMSELYAGCVRQLRAGDYAIIPGPGGLVGIAVREESRRRVEIWWKDRLLGTVPSVDTIAFAPK